MQLVGQTIYDLRDGLAYLHSQGIANKDLETANILVSNQHYISLSTDS